MLLGVLQVVDLSHEALDRSRPVGRNGRRFPHTAQIALDPFTARIRAAHPDRGIPEFDPADAQDRARLLVLLEAPGPGAHAARGGSGRVSVDNAAPSSRTLRELLAEAGVDRGRELVVWNAVPWYLGTERRIRAARAGDVAAGLPWLAELLGLLPELRAIVPLGRTAQRAWAALGSGLPAFPAPHPSPANLAARPWAREELRDALLAARRTLRP